jgi:superfamily I DNA and/or RNA helicase
MHCEQNLSKNILKTITGHKDTVKVRSDLQRREIRKHLWLTSNPKKPRKMLKPAAPYVLTSEEFDVFASTIESLKAPSGHISNIAQYIRKKKFRGTKIT